MVYSQELLREGNHIFPDHLTCHNRLLPPLLVSGRDITFLVCHIVELPSLSVFLSSMIFRFGFRPLLDQLIPRQSKASKSETALFAIFPD